MDAGKACPLENNRKPFLFGRIHAFVMDMRIEYDVLAEKNLFAGVKLEAVCTCFISGEVLHKNE